jgi:hypothetical protein
MHDVARRAHSGCSLGEANSAVHLAGWDCDPPSLSQNWAMPLATPLTTFGELARDHLEIEVTCGNCGHRRTIDAASPRLRDRRVAGARFRCEQCGSVGLPTIGKRHRWPDRLADRALKLR